MVAYTKPHKRKKTPEGSVSGSNVICLLKATKLRCSKEWFAKIITFGFCIDKKLKEHLRKVKRPQGRPKTTWMQTVRQDLATFGIELDLFLGAHTVGTLSRLTHDRKNWRGNL